MFRTWSVKLTFSDWKFLHPHLPRTQHKSVIWQNILIFYLQTHKESFSVSYKNNFFPSENKLVSSSPLWFIEPDAHFPPKHPKRRLICPQSTCPLSFCPSVSCGDIDHGDMVVYHAGASWGLEGHTANLQPWFHTSPHTPGFFSLY